MVSRHWGSLLGPSNKTYNNPYFSELQEEIRSLRKQLQKHGHPRCALAYTCWVAAGAVLSKQRKPSKFKSEQGLGLRAAGALSFIWKAPPHIGGL